MSFCVNCGAKLDDDSHFCDKCGSPVKSAQIQPTITRAVPMQSSNNRLFCPRCHSYNITTQTFQEQKQSVTTGVSSTNLREKRHGFIWWLFVGWWWMIIKGILWVIAFIPMALIRAGRKRKYVGTTKTVNTTVNSIQYRVICTCHSCGNTWQLQ